VTDNSKFIEELSPKKRALFELLLKEKRNQALQRLQIPNRAQASSYPLSFTQQRLWILDQLAPDRASYNIYFAVHLRGKLNVDAMEKSFNEIIRRHEVLRTTFRIIDGQPAQLIAPRASLPLARIDVSHHCEPERHRLIQLCIDEQIRRPFDLSESFPIRVTLLKDSDEDHVIILVVHHIAFDGWSMGVLIRELKLLYEAFAAGYPSPLTQLSIQYADFAVWQRSWLQGQLLEEQLNYWKRQLGGINYPLELPTDYEAQCERAPSGAFRLFLLSQEIGESLKALSCREGVTLFMTLLAAFQTLLHRYSGQTEIAVGSPVAYRNWAETENLIGCFVNTIVLQVNMSGNPTFRALLANVREIAQGAYANQDLPFDLVVNALQPERNSTNTPLFRVWFVLQNLHDRPSRFSGLSLRYFHVPEGVVQFDLALTMSESNSGIEGCFHYNRNLFEASTIEEIKGHFTTLLEQVTVNPDLHLLDIPL
jgi:condensation domain-containing protein